MKVMYKHTNIIAQDWRALARFYEKAFDCVRVPPVRRLSGSWLEKGTGISAAKLSGVHLRLPGHGSKGPTLEIFQFAQNEARIQPTQANREGLAHIAFEVDDIEHAMSEVLRYGGKKVGNLVTHDVEGVGTLSFVYMADPEGNIIELQRWK
ncbi:MAG: glyoxalase [Dehalococcoidia bacterium SG8_51_3]|uniref:Glyoxalase n=1 Tax=candidate division WOR_3 bacterium SM23_42 TaxID=1703779 RepID=A0A0S8FR87_UNCW3|nr:MAG: glyoxalase [Dehalococcoidia bacterium SG8_51_3]KPK63054.1 MAG: glyoxalase [candidate division WOR_3 bacterium SM23_42]